MKVDDEGADGILIDAVRARIAALRAELGYAVGDAAFAAWVLEILRAAADPAAALGAVHLADLYLAYACGMGCRKAHAALERTMLSQIPRYVAVVDPSAAFADEVAQQLRDRLLVAADGPPKILTYTGRGPLGGWLRVAAVRTARNLKRGAGAAPIPIDERADLPAVGADPELAAIKSRWGREFREALEETLVALPARERAVLRLSFVDGLSSEAIAKIYGVSGAAVRLWLKGLRSSIVEETQKRLALRLGGADLHDLPALIHTAFDLTLSRVLLDAPSD